MVAAGRFNCVGSGGQILLDAVKVIGVQSFPLAVEGSR